MSGSAMEWACDARKTGPLTPTDRAVLIVLAKHAQPDGTRVYPGRALIAKHLDVDPRTVSRSIAALMASGHITHGDQRLVEYIPHYCRPVVYDLAIGKPLEDYNSDGDQEAAEPVDNTPAGPPDEDVTPCQEEVVPPDESGSDPLTRMSTKPRTEPSTESLSPDQRLVAQLLGLPGDDERLESVPKMLQDNSSKNPRAWIRAVAQNGDLTDRLTEAHAITTQHIRYEVDLSAMKCLHGKVNGHITCPTCTDAMVGA